MKNEIPSVNIIREFGSRSAEAARKTKLEREAKTREEEVQAAAKFVRNNLDWVRSKISDALRSSATTKCGSFTYSFGTNQGWRDLRDLIKAELEKKGYKVHVEYSPGEVGRAAYDEQDTPASFEMTISW